jgi:pyridoxal biosynthesis lyase PdxS
VITPADEEHHIDKWAFQVPFFYGATRKQMISMRRSSTRNCRTEL